eukprot:1139535-Pelagomonas_calceolata.AAC.1
MNLADPKEKLRTTPHCHAKTLAKEGGPRRCTDRLTHPHEVQTERSTAGRERRQVQQQERKQEAKEGKAHDWTGSFRLTYSTLVGCS